MSEVLAHTPLNEEHIALGAKMVPFAGFSMPVQYPTGITEEHRAVRETAGLFDVSHMGEFRIEGPDALELVQGLTVNDVHRVEPWQAQYSAFCNAAGGVIDDLLVYRFPDHLILVVNASNRERDLAWVRKHAEGRTVTVTDESDSTALLALQGPAASPILQRLTGTDLDAIAYYHFAAGEVAGVPATISRTGYTGEDGFELYVPAERAGELWSRLLEEGRPEGLIATGLGARDSLRLEVGFALYGNDLDEEHTALESGLGWIVKLEAGDFVGRAALAAQKAEGVPRRLVGFRLRERGFPRPGYEIASDGEVVGSVTSGTLSPTLGEGLGMGYVPTRLAKPGSEIAIRIRGREFAATVERPPFYKEGSVRR